MTLLTVDHLSKSFVTRRNALGRVVHRLAAVDDVSFTVERGEVVALVGESGAGKSTIGRLVTRLTEPDTGAIMLGGADVRAMSAAELRRSRRQMQMVFQDPYSSFDPRRTIADGVTEPLGRLSRGLRRDRARLLLIDVGLDSAYVDSYPRDLSGGQLQRCAIARALSVEPALIVCDEPVTALDVSIQAQIINLLQDLRRERDVSYLFISHDLELVRLLADRVIVLQHGAVVEVGPVAEIYERPASDYTRELLAARPSLDPDAPRIRLQATAEPG